MAVRHGTVAVATTAVKVFAAGNRFGTLTVKNEDATIKCFVGGPTVTNSGATAGVSLAGGASMQVVCSGKDSDVWVSSASGTPNISFIFA